MKTVIITLAVTLALATPGFSKPTSKAQSDVTAKYNQTLNGIAQNFK